MPEIEWLNERTNDTTMELEIELTALLQQSKDQLAAKLAESAKERLLETLTWRMSSALEDAVNEYVKTEIIPEVSKRLVEQKAGLVEALHVGIVETVKAIGLKMAEEAQKTMKSSYSFEQFIKALFRG